MSLSEPDPVHSRLSAGRVRLQSRFVFAAPLVPAALVLACWIWWADTQGGYFSRDWSPTGIMLVFLAFVVAIGMRRVLPARRSVAIALFLFAGFVGWSYLSMLWAESPGSAWEAAAKLTPALAGCWTLSLLPWRTATATAFLGAWAIGVTLVCFFALLGARGGPELGGLTTAGRLTVPMGYSNAAASLAWMAFFPALLLSYRRGLPPLVQGLGLGAAVFLLEYGLLPQSRGALLAVAVAGVIFVALAADRLRLLLRLGVLAALLALSVQSILDVQLAADARSGLGAALDDAERAMVLMASLGALAGLALALLELSLERREQAVRAARAAGMGVLSLGFVTVAVVVAFNAGSWFSGVGERWDRLTDEDTTAEGRNSRFGTLDPDGRTDLWRVAVNLFEERPVTGIGLGNYEREHTARRVVERHSRYVHSLWLRVLAEAGLIGALFLFGALLTVLAAALTRLRRLDPATRVVAASCLAVSAVFLAHSSVDWMEEFPALALPGLGLPFLAASLDGVRTPQPNPRRLGRPALAVGALLTVAAALAITLPYLATLWTERSLERFRADPAEAYRDLERARWVNPLSVRGWTTEGTIALALGDEARARRAFERSVNVEDNWYAHLELALLAAQSGRFLAAQREIEASRRLNAADPSVTRAQTLILRRRRIEPLDFNRRLLKETRSYFTRPET